MIFFLVSGAFYVSPKRKYLLIVIPLCCNAVKISSLVSFFFLNLAFVSHLTSLDQEFFQRFISVLSA